MLSRGRHDKSHTFLNRSIVIRVTLHYNNIIVIVRFARSAAQRSARFACDVQWVTVQRGILYMYAWPPVRWAGETIAQRRRHYRRSKRPILHVYVCVMNIEIELNKIKRKIRNENKYRTKKRSRKKFRLKVQYVSYVT